VKPKGRGPEDGFTMVKSGMAVVKKKVDSGVSYWETSGPEGEDKVSLAPGQPLELIPGQFNQGDMIVFYERKV